MLQPIDLNKIIFSIMKNTLISTLTKIAPYVYVTFAVMLFVLLLSPELIFAQPPPLLPSGDIQQTPIDGGIVVAAVAGGAYALKKLRKK
jgi:hypothetical protein